ncbi:hypothetical protein E2C01_046320 [Portunus trituberculatus]|uniref:Uncharacterized protein n=1 Tax=Portunus trituberculatus TaxID=210409 RepID=A0A5B7FXJ7_PORTR|nr:hypothetical protein [Portunus trituberculatus]
MSRIHMKSEGQRKRGQTCQVKVEADKERWSDRKLASGGLRRHAPVSVPRQPGTLTSWPFTLHQAPAVAPSVQHLAMRSRSGRRCRADGTMESRRKLARNRRLGWHAYRHLSERSLHQRILSVQRGEWSE